ncbi:MAG TPA: hypothetical protein VFW76_08805 [Ktedonobacterales bacterium]|nr:hypothetical protein [Ktedonobacterales bacterium]
MLTQLLQFQLQWIILPILAIPLAILLGARRTHGAIIVSSVAALIAVAYAWYRNVTDVLGYGMHVSNLGSLDGVVAQVGGVLLLAAWTMALAHAAQTKRWVWFALIVVAGFLSYSITILAEVNVQPCAFIPPDSASLPVCQPINLWIYLLIALGEALGPAALLLYVVLTSRGQHPWHQRQLPEGLVVSSLHEEIRPGEDVASAD